MYMKTTQKGWSGSGGRWTVVAQGDYRRSKSDCATASPALLASLPGGGVTASKNLSRDSITVVACMHTPPVHAGDTITVMSQPTCRPNSPSRAFGHGAWA
ncbi:hypothetical protein ZHAS_00003610 [Anopheles sinensis]|uniref:Uncharacterized protein n=1 Tax=Anopheles sinensis TaxID=74873 RepID=A0A084VET1_ANOSI|nr:hypothetical protein ZHAS_00003610 [Anopheles sinensis]